MNDFFFFKFIQGALTGKIFKNFMNALIANLKEQGKLRKVILIMTMSLY